MTIKERILSKIKKAKSGCWEWTAYKNWKGYARIHVGGRVRFGHRVAYEAFRGPIPAGLTIDHLCRNRACVNPDHLEPVTMKVNCLRGFSPSSIHAKKTHCPKGHEYSEENTYWHGPNHRMCRVCWKLKYLREKALSAMRVSA